MSFCKFSSSYQSKNQTLIDNVFITDFLPKAPDLCVKAYLLGLCKCSTSDDYENSLEYFAKTCKLHTLLSLYIIPVPKFALDGKFDGTCTETLWVIP